MTLHIDYTHTCKACNGGYLAYKPMNCPHCGEASDFVDEHAIEKIARSAAHNMRSGQKYVPGAWLEITIGDTIAYTVFQILDKLRASHIDVVNRDIVRRELGVKPGTFSPVNEHLIDVVLAVRDRLQYLDPQKKI